MRHPMAQDVKERFEHYPSAAQQALLQLREMIFELCKQHQLGAVEESLKWGEPSFSVKHGSPVRIDWKPKHPEHCCVFFNCKTRLVDTFRELFGTDTHTLFQGNRAILLSIEQPLPEAMLKQCLLMALTYHSIKHLPLLGARSPLLQ